jgi:hypothetical protein
VTIAVTVKIIVDFARSPRITLPLIQAASLLDCIVEKHGSTRDTEEAKRIIASFDDYYAYARRKFHDYLSLPKDPGDSIRGRVVLQKLRLIREGESRSVELVFDRRFSIDLLRECAAKVTGEEVIVERQLV